MPCIKLAAFDMDGTLLTRDSRMTEVTKEACRRLQQEGCKLLLSTGRTFVSARMPIDNFPFDGYVCSNGAAIFERDGKLVQSSLLPGRIVVELVEQIRQRPVYYELHDTESNRWIIREDREQIDELQKTGTGETGVLLSQTTFYHLSKGIEKAELFDSILSGQISVVKIFFWSGSPAVLEWVREVAAPWTEEADITSSGIKNVEIMKKGVNKWEGLQYFLRKWGIDAADVAAFGDADNDRDILSRVGHSIAMGNASQSIKELARYIAKSNEEDGVAQFIQEHLLQSS
ncbi:Cof-type HAD-IIB family hydrolase [Brevibacillus massiliensis]|uniref:Cof-type HAD-IIB family hydrolase n=1 Tax=Brevibacillus massiliensis TaxID=1118054 RepID=UPI0002F07660|nr:Cof-type HAD-IIB family hydrolase [Brevibacillus massiliensis]